jgi:hypothetical protein
MCLGPQIEVEQVEKQGHEEVWQGMGEWLQANYKINNIGFLPVLQSDQLQTPC